MSGNTSKERKRNKPYFDTSVDYSTEGSKQQAQYFYTKLKEASKLANCTEDTGMICFDFKQNMPSHSCQLQTYFTVARCGYMLCQSTRGKHPRALCTVGQKLRQKADKMKLCLSFIIILSPSYQALSRNCMGLVMVAEAKIRIRQCLNFGSLKL
jgi:hypothetical protein